MYEDVSRKKRILVLSFCILFFFTLPVYILNSYLGNIENIYSEISIIIYDRDDSIAIPGIWISVLCTIYLILLFINISKKNKSYVQKYSLIITVIVFIVTSIFVHRNIIQSFSDVGYVPCGKFFGQRYKDSTRSVFDKRAWVLNVRDCAQVEAYPPR